MLNPNDRTEALLNEINHTDDLEDLLKLFDARDSAAPQAPVPACLYALMSPRAIAPAELARLANMNRSYLYQIFRSEKTPSRNTLLQMAFALGASHEETDRLLKAGGHGPLYAKDKRDAVMIFSIRKALPLADVCELLDELGLEPLYKV